MKRLSDLTKDSLICSRGLIEERGPHTCSRPCALEKKKKHKINHDARKTHHEIHSSPVTAITSKQWSTKNVSRVGPCQHASIDLGYVVICLVQLSQSVITTKVTQKQIQTDRARQTDRLMKYWHPVGTPVLRSFLPIGKNRPHFERISPG